MAARLAIVLGEVDTSPGRAAGIGAPLACQRGLALAAIPQSATTTTTKTRHRHWSPYGDQCGRFWLGGRGRRPRRDCAPPDLVRYVTPVVQPPANATADGHENFDGDPGQEEAAAGGLGQRGAGVTGGAAHRQEGGTSGN